MISFKCANCGASIQTEYASIGDSGECPSCGTLQIVPDPPLEPGSLFNRHRILRAEESDLLWNSYKVTDSSGIQNAEYLLKIPTTFFLRNVTSLPFFSQTVVKNGSLGLPEFPLLRDKSFAPSNTYLVYEFLKSSRLLSEERGRQPMGYSEAIGVVLRLARALQSVWDKSGSAHQNLRPENIRVTPITHKVQIMNMGISDFLLKDRRLLDNGFNIWDFRYMSPEFVDIGKADTPACDIYSVGCVLHLMLTGRDPHDDCDNIDRILMSNQLEPEKLNPSVPDSVAEFVRLLTERNPNLRPRAWSQVIEKALVFLPGKERAHTSKNTVGRLNLWGVFSAERNRRLPTGQSIGIGGHPDFKRRLKHSLEPKPDQPCLTLRPPKRGVFPVSVGALPHSRWGEGRQLTFVNAAMLVVLVAFAGFGGYSLLRMSMGDSSPKRIGLIQATPKNRIHGVGGDASAADSRLIKNGSDDGHRKLSMSDEIAEVDEFHEANPASFDEVMRRYEEIKLKAVRSGNEQLIERLNDRIRTVERKKEAQVDVALKSLMSKVVALIEANEADKAIGILEKYDGPFADYTARTRGELIRNIENGVKVGIGSTLISVSKNLALNTLDNELAKIAPVLLAGDFEKGKGVLLGLSQRADLKGVKTEIDAMVRDVEYASSLKDIGEASVSELLRRVDGVRFGNDQLLRGLIHFRHGDYDKAAWHFDQIPFNLGAQFKQAQLEKQAEVALRELFSKHTIEYRTARHDESLAGLSKKTLPLPSARKLLADLEGYRVRFDDSGFLANNDAVIAAVEEACRHAIDSAMVKELVINGLAAAGLSPGRQFAEALSKTEENAVINLKKGVYLLTPGETSEPKALPAGAPRQRQVFRIGLGGVSIIGEDGVVLRDGVEINAQSVRIANIKVVSGGLSISPTKDAKVLAGAGNIVVKNCVFEGDECRISNSMNIHFENCLFKGLIIENCRNVSLRHCTILANDDAAKRGAALMIEGGDVELSDSIAYGPRFGVVFIRKESEKTDSSPARDYASEASRSIKISRTLWYGGEAICATQYGKMPISEKDSVKVMARINRFCRPSMNIYSPPQFANPQDGNWRLAKGSKGFMACRDGYDCGVIWR